MTKMCEHKWKYAYGISVSDITIAAKICIKCYKIIKLGCVGLDEIEPEWIYWYNNTPTNDPPINL